MSRIERKQAEPVSEAILTYIKISGLAPGWNTHKIFSAWDKVSGASQYTLKKFYRGGKLYITVNSSVVCSKLQFQRDIFKEEINKILENDPMFIQDNRIVGMVKELIIK